MYLFTESGTRLLESLCFTKTLFAFDFDGTLAKIVKEPENAKLNDSTAKLIYELSKLAPTAVISGRGLSDLKSKFRFPIRNLVGNHGLEGIHDDDIDTHSFQKACAAWKKQIEKALRKSAINGIEIEDKTFSLAVHYRKSRQRRVAKNVILESIGHIQPSARVILGKCVVNIVPTGGPHKGVALLELMLKSDTKSAFYIGDDDTDEDIFSLSDPRVFTVRIGKKNNSHAKFFLHRQSQINLLLKLLISFLDKTQNKREQFVGLHKNIRN
jgi:trehalose 6-phosphate phosphatase